MTSLHIFYASTSGHTEFVVRTLEAFLKESAPQVAVETGRVEKAKPEDLRRGDALLLASGTWNTGGVEGQPNPHMAVFLEAVKGVDLKGKPMAFIALGDSRYYYTARVAEHFQRFRMAKEGKQLLPPLIIVDEPYGQEERIRAWGKKLAEVMEQNAK
ncbi:MAG: flavodoxin family protein [Candidatus Peribacteraceae bacterium]|jgi:flavodoxin